MTTKTKRQAFTLSNLRDVKYGSVAEYRYDSGYSGRDDDTDGLRHDGIIENFRVVSVSIPNAVDFVVTNKHAAKLIDRYGLDRILRFLKVYDPALWDWTSQHGYYGDEVGSVYLDDRTLHVVEEMYADFRALKTVASKTLFLLKMEYGYVLDVLKGVKKFVVKTGVPIGEVYLPNDRYVKKVDPVSFYDGYDLIHAVTIVDGKRYRVLDGYNRMVAALKNGKRKVNLIVAWR